MKPSVTIKTIGMSTTTLGKKGGKTLYSGMCGES